MEGNLIELASRRSAGVEVRLLWNKSRGKVILSVSDEEAGTKFQLAVANTDAMHAFRHPFAYAQRYAPLPAA